jgi:large subunit ribosomal protein L17
MRHRWGGRKLGRTTPHRSAMLRNMVTSLLEHERIETTDAKAKEVRRVAERMITLGKRGDLHARRQALRVVRSREVAAKLFDELAPRYAERAGGYTRVLKVGRRVGDAAPFSLVELVDRGLEVSAPAAEKGSRVRRGRKKAAETEKAETKAGGRKRAKGRAAAAEEAPSGAKKKATRTKRAKA